MDDLKLFSRNEEQIDTFVRTAHIISTDIGIEFEMRKCGILTMKLEGNRIRINFLEFYC